MLPPGHASAGYLVALGIASFFHVSLYDPQAQDLLWAGFIFGAIPDLDMFAAFFKTRSLVIQNDKKSHRSYITHTPMFWIAIAGITAVIMRDLALSLVIIFASLSHLFLDTIEDEVRWLWPFVKKPYRILRRIEDLTLPKESFFSYWKHFVVWYIKNRTITATIEAATVLLFFSLLLLAA